MHHIQVHRITPAIMMVSAIISLCCIIALFSFLLNNRYSIYAEGYKDGVKAAETVNEQNLILTKKAGLCAYSEMVCHTK
jgi:hypothetical protein